MVRNGKKSQEPKTTAERREAWVGTIVDYRIAVFSRFPPPGAGEATRANMTMQVFLNPNELEDWPT